MQFKEQSKKKAVTFSYDDGVTQDIHLIQMMDRYGLKGTFNLNSELLGKSGMLTRGGQRISHYKLDPRDVRTVYEGHEVAVHTLTHPNLTDLTQAEVIRQVEKDRQNLSALVGYEVVGMAYPCGGVNNDDRVAEIIKNHTGVRYARTITDTHSFAPQENLYRFNPSVYHIMDYEKLMEMGRQFVELETEEPAVFYVWGHSYEMDYAPEGWARLDEFFRLISGREDIFYGTNREILL